MSTLNWTAFFFFTLKLFNKLGCHTNLSIKLWVEMWVEEGEWDEQWLFESSLLSQMTSCLIGRTSAPAAWAETVNVSPLFLRGTKSSNLFVTLLPVVKFFFPCLYHKECWVSLLQTLLRSSFKPLPQTVLCAVCDCPSLSGFAVMSGSLVLDAGQGKILQ